MKITDLPEFSAISGTDKLLAIQAVDGSVGLVKADNFASANNTPQPQVITPWQYLGKNTTAQGNWGGVYGSKGCFLMRWNGGNDVIRFPLNLINYTLTSGSGWSYSNADIKAIPGNVENFGIRKAFVYFGTPLILTFSAFTKEVGKVAVYGCDYDNGRGTLTARCASLSDPTKFAEGTLTEPEYNNGGYLQFTYEGSFTLTLSSSVGNAVATAVFFD